MKRIEKSFTVVRKPFIFDDYNQTLRSFELEKNEGTFRITTSVADCIFMGILPFGLLIFLNAWIYIHAKQERKIVSSCSGSGKITEATDNTIRMQEIRIAMTFISIVICFLTCYSLWLVHAIITAISYWKYDECQNSQETHPICNAASSKGFIAMEYIGHLLIIINSSVNILLYGLSWDEFQEAAKELIVEICPCLTLNNPKVPELEVPFLPDEKDTLPVQLSDIERAISIISASHHSDSINRLNK